MRDAERYDTPVLKPCDIVKAELQMEEVIEQAVVWSCPLTITVVTLLRGEAL